MEFFYLIDSHFVSSTGQHSMSVEVIIVRVTSLF
jgi:hypothetical protein